MDEQLRITTNVPGTDPAVLDRVTKLLDSVDLTIDGDVEILVLAWEGDELIGCMGLAGAVVKSAAISPEHQGRNLMGLMLTEIRYLALERGNPKLFLYTKPMYEQMFAQAGFHLLVTVPGLVVLMEDDPHGLSDYLASLAPSRVDGERIAGIVVNANPFTLGHQYLVQTAARECDYVHVFVVGEDVSQFKYEDRLALVQAGVAALPEASRIKVHPGSRYIVSRASFPQYFLKEAADISRAFTGIDLQLFRNYIAPVLGIRHRYVGTEPASEITNRYNEEMLHWLTVPSAYPPIEVHVVSRIGRDEIEFISASKVRAYIEEGNLEALERVLPPTTFAFVREKYFAQTPRQSGES